MIINSDIKEELEVIRKNNQGLLHPEQVVEYARNPETKLHGKFEWDDTEAANSYRILQAQQIIRVVITIIPNTTEETRMYVSLSSDRVNNGAYRYIADVLSDELSKTQLISDVLSELRAFQRKFAILQNVSEHFAQGIVILKGMEAKLLQESSPKSRSKKVKKAMDKHLHP